MDTIKVGKNIRFLRKLYGLTLEELGAIIHVEKSAVSQYENAKRVPDRNMLETIASYFAISVDELIEKDFSKIGDNLSSYANFFIDNIDTIFPIIVSKKAKAIDQFADALSCHKDLFSKIKKDGFTQEIVENLFACIEMYASASEQTAAYEESFGNLMGLFVLIGLGFPSNITEFLDSAPGKAAINLFGKSNNNASLPSDIERSSLADLESNSLEWKTEIDEMLGEMKESQKLYKLADYYLALSYLFNCVNNNLSYPKNREIGDEMMRAFARLHNPYAKRFLALLRSFSQPISSQSVNDKK